MNMKRILSETMQDLAICAAGAAVVTLTILLMMRGEAWTARTLGLPYRDTRLWLAVGSGECALIGRALDEGARIDAVNEAGNTPLIVAAFGTDVRVVRELLRDGADPNQASADGVTPLLSAIFGERVETVKILLDAGASPDRVASARVSPFVAAVGTGNLAVVELLIAAGADSADMCGAEEF
jgi:hypothetical protein